MEKKLTQSQEQFAMLVALKNMSYAEAAREAYPSKKRPAQTGFQASRSRAVAARIDYLRKETEQIQTDARAEFIKYDHIAKIAGSEERETFWTDLMRDNAERTRDRLAASELLGKKQRDFIQQIESKTLTATVDLSQFSLEDLKSILTEVIRKRMLNNGTGTTE